MPDGVGAPTSYMAYQTIGDRCMGKASSSGLVSGCCIGWSNVLEGESEQRVS